MLSLEDCEEHFPSLFCTLHVHTACVVVFLVPTSSSCCVVEPEIIITSVAVKVGLNSLLLLGRRRFLYSMDMMLMVVGRKKEGKDGREGM